jgi:hypothetical protein
MSYRGRCARRREAKLAVRAAELQKARETGRAEGHAAGERSGEARALRRLEAWDARTHLEWERNVYLNEPLHGGRPFVVPVPMSSESALAAPYIERILRTETFHTTTWALGGSIRWYNIEAQNEERRRKAYPLASKALSYADRCRRMAAFWRVDGELTESLDIVRATLYHWLGEWQPFLDIAQSDAVQARKARREELPW